MKLPILTEQQEQSILAQLIAAGCADPEETLKTAHTVVSGVDRVERDGIAFFNKEPNDSIVSILFFVDEGNSDYRHFSTRSSCQWPSPILVGGLNTVVDEFHATAGTVQTIHQIKDLLTYHVNQKMTGDEDMLNHPLKSALARLGIPGATHPVSSHTSPEGCLLLKAVRKIPVPGTEADIRLRLEIITILSSKSGPPPRIIEVAVTPDPTIELFTGSGYRTPGSLSYHYQERPIPGIREIERDVRLLIAKQEPEVSQTLEKARQIIRSQRPTETMENFHYRPRH